MYCIKLHRVYVEKKFYSPTGNMRGKLDVLGMYVSQGDVFDNPCLCILVNPTNSVWLRYSSVQFCCKASV